MFAYTAKYVAARVRDGKTSWLWNTTSRFHSGANANYHMVLGPCWFQLSLCLLSRHSSTSLIPHSSLRLHMERRMDHDSFEDTTLKRNGLADTHWLLTVKSRIPAGLASFDCVSGTVAL